MNSSRQPPKSPTVAAKPPPEEWGQHEHVSEPAQSAAQRLLDLTQTPDLAKLAIDTAWERRVINDQTREKFARVLGFDAYQRARDASKCVGPIDGTNWYVTPRQPDRWVVWNERDLQIEFTCESIQDAVRQMHDRMS